MNRDSIPLLRKRSAEAGLTLGRASLCILDIFGVFPIIALPRAIVQCGWLGVPLVVSVITMQIYTAVLVGKSWDLATNIDPNIFRKNRYPLAAVTELTLGRWASVIVAILLDLSIFGGGIPNLLVASQNLQLFGLKVSNRDFNISFCYWLLAVGILLCPVMWLGSPRDMKWLTRFSTSTIYITTFLMWWAILSDRRKLDFEEIPSSPSWENFISGYGMLAFQFDVHPTLMTIQVDMKRPKDIKQAVYVAFFNHTHKHTHGRVEENRRGSHVAPNNAASLHYLYRFYENKVIVSMFGITTGLVVWRYAGSATANILQIVPSGWPIDVAILLAAVQLCLSNCIGYSALFQNLEDHLRVQRSFGWKRCALRSAVVLLAIAVGESVPRFDIVMSLIGGTLTGPLVFILPPLMYIRAKARLRGGIPRRSSAPAYLFSRPERRQGFADGFADPRVHSKSTHYGFRDGDENKNDGYSFIYYDDNEVETNPYIEDEVDSSNEYGSISTKPTAAAQEIMRSESLPTIMTDANRPSMQESRQRKKINVQKTSKKFWTTDKLSDWFGYCIVIIGILTTASSTYINVGNSITFVRFIPPCIINATAELPSLI